MPYIAVLAVVVTVWEGQHASARRFSEIDEKIWYRPSWMRGAGASMCENEGRKTRGRRDASDQSKIDCPYM